jgi:putative hydrolase of the HAD superfamily
VARELYINYATQAPYEVFPDATKFLDSMQAARDARKVRVGALTNFDRRIYSLVSSLGLSTKFDFITCSEDAGSSKPEPEIFRKAAQQSNQVDKLKYLPLFSYISHTKMFTNMYLFSCFFTLT